jgi:hypothetical protein
MTSPIVASGIIILTVLALAAYAAVRLTAAQV